MEEGLGFMVILHSVSVAGVVREGLSELSWEPEESGWVSPADILGGGVWGVVQGRGQQEERP